MKLSGDEHKKLEDSILQAYQKKSDLEMIVRYSLEEKLDEIVGGDTTKEIVFRLIEWAVAEGKLKPLLEAISEDRKDNYQLQKTVNDLLEKSKKLETINNQKEKYKIKKIDLAKINFEAARRQIDPRCEELKNNGGVLSLIVERSHNYMGDLLIEEVRDRFKNGKPNFKSVLIDPESGGWSDNQGLLRNIAQELNIAIEGINLTPEYLIEEIAKQCCPGRIFFFELLNWDALGEGCQEDMLRWFYSCFWNSLIIRRLQIEPYAKKVRFISTVNSRESLNIEDFFDLNCSELIKVEACRWQEEEIDSWLTEYGQFSSNNELGGEVKMIMRRSEGIPLSVYELLLKRFCFI